VRSRLIKLALAAAVVLAVWALIAPSLANYLIVEKPLERANAIFVLSGSAAYKERTKKAAELYRQGIAPRIFITNDGERAGWSETEKRNPPYVELERRELIANGVMPDAITVLPGEVAGTDQEAKALANEIDERPFGSVVLVTSPYHTRRALWTFEKFLEGKGVAIGIEHATHDDRYPTSANWWMSKTGWQLVGGEYVKSIAYWMFN